MDDGGQVIGRLLAGVFIFFVVVPGIGLLWRRLKHAVTSHRISPQEEAEFEAIVAHANEARRSAEERERQAAARWGEVREPTESSADIRVGPKVACKSTGWQARPPDLVASGGCGEIHNRFTYRGLWGDAELVMQIECDLAINQMAAELVRSSGGKSETVTLDAHFVIRFLPNPGITESDIIGVIGSEDSSRSAGPMSLKFGQARDGSVFLQVESQQQTWALLNLLRAGGDMIIHLFSPSMEPILKLPLPVGLGFGSCYNSLMSK